MRISPVVFWDFDGTIAQRQNRWSGALLDAWKVVDPTTTATVDQLRPHLKSGFPWHDPDTIREVPSPAEWWARVEPMFIAAYTANGLSPARARLAASHVPQQYYRLDAWSLTEGIEDALRRTRDAGFRNIILSNHAPELPRLVRSLGLNKWVERTITSAGVGVEKPNPAIFRHSIEVADADVRTSWMVGDNPIADIQGARAAGLRAILIGGSAPDTAGLTATEAANRILRHNRVRRD